MWMYNDISSSPSSRTRSRYASFSFRCLEVLSFFRICDSAKPPEKVCTPPPAALRCSRYSGGFYLFSEALVGGEKYHARLALAYEKRLKIISSNMNLRAETTSTRLDKGMTE